MSANWSDSGRSHRDDGVRGAGRRGGGGGGWGGGVGGGGGRDGGGGVMPEQWHSRGTWGVIAVPPPKNMPVSSAVSKETLVQLDP